MFRRKAIGAMIVMAVSGAAVSGAGLAQASTAHAPAVRTAHAVLAVATARHAPRAPLPPGATPARHPRATMRTPRFLHKAAPNDLFSCYGTDSILSDANSNWVSAELAYFGDGYAMLRARASSIGGWEQFTFCYDSTSNYWAFYSDANDEFVSTELGYTGGNYAMLRARASSIGAWEQYSLICNTNGSLSIRSNANGLYVSTELGYGGSSYAMLRARASTVGPWEQYQSPQLLIC